MLYYIIVITLYRALSKIVAVVAASPLLFSVGLPPAMSDPDAPTDSQGFVDSTARCDPPSSLIAFGNTTTSRIAICRTANGQFEYRGVRVADSAKLIAPAAYRDNAYIAVDDGNIYTVTMRAVTVSRDGAIISQEPMENFFQPGTGGPSKEKSS